MNGFQQLSVSEIAAGLDDQAQRHSNSNHMARANCSWSNHMPGDIPEETSTRCNIHSRKQEPAAGDIVCEKLDLVVRREDKLAVSLANGPFKGSVIFERGYIHRRHIRKFVQGRQHRSGSTDVFGLGVQQNSVAQSTSYTLRHVLVQGEPCVQRVGEARIIARRQLDSSTEEGELRASSW